MNYLNEKLQRRKNESDAIMEKFIIHNFTFFNVARAEALHNQNYF